MLNAHAPDFVPLAWAVNAFASVLGSPLSIVTAMAVGFTTSLYLAAVVYALGFVALANQLKRWKA